MAACMSRHCLMLFAGAILALTFVHGLEAAVPSPDKWPCDKQDNDEPETLCRATINCHCISGTYLDIPCDTFDQDNIDCSSYCKPCPYGKFSPFDNRCLACRPVTPCKPNEEVLINATGRADKVCGCRRQDLTCPPCPEQTTPTVTSTQVETVVDPSVNPPPCPQKEQATDPQWTFDGWSFVIGFFVPICLVLFPIVILWVLLKKRVYRLRLPSSFTVLMLCCHLSALLLSCIKQSWYVN
ncbi:tumor necrosis factor receptor superfamily member 26-like [Patiria miniata]|uniref:TNFR-Cys domain-containing protein n=1 Tax=Patiria miniata TaxID=46514 RepID=A0A914BH13_PATMI|nr:tumor necrosis factor receptor superfamily member 26-like [Patiria miniata]